MYTAFNLKINLDDLSWGNEYIKIGKQNKENLSDFVKRELDSFILSDEIIDGEKLSEVWFKTKEYDIFISHSHNDADLALALSGWLKKEFNLKVFLDEVVWGSADELLRKLDDKYSYQKDTGTYNYRRRNFTTSHVHAMLSAAIQSVMDKSEAIFFLNTEESFPAISNVLEENSKYTLSPWIYQEVMNAKLLRPIKWYEYRNKSVLSHSVCESVSDNLKIAYKIPLNDFKMLDKSVLSNWHEQYSINRSRSCGALINEMCNHPLNLLYDIVFEKIVKDG